MSRWLVYSKIVKIKNKYRVVSESGKNLGTYNTRAEAEKRLKQVEYFKHKEKWKCLEDLEHLQN